MLWVHWILVGLGLFVVGNIVVWYCPAYQRWLARIEAENAAMIAAAEAAAAAALQEALLDIVTQAYLADLPPLETPRVRLPAVARLQP